MFNAASPTKSRTAAVTAVDGLYQDKPAFQPEAASQALSSATLRSFM